MTFTVSVSVNPSVFPVVSQFTHPPFLLWTHSPSSPLIYPPACPSNHPADPLASPSYCLPACQPIDPSHPRLPVLPPVCLPIRLIVPLSPARLSARLLAPPLSYARQPVSPPVCLPACLSVIYLQVVNAIVTTDSINFVSKDRHTDCIAGKFHGGQNCPGVRRWVISLAAIKPKRVIHKNVADGMVRHKNLVPSKTGKTLRLYHLNVMAVTELPIKIA